MMTSCANYKYNGFIDCLKKIVRKEGPKSLFRGGNIIFLQAMSGSTIYYIFDKIFATMSTKHWHFFCGRVNNSLGPDFY